LTRVDPALLSKPTQTWTIKKSFFNDVERIIADNRNSIVKAHEGMDLLVRMLALVVKANAQKRSMGAVAPTRRSVPALANRIPVQRITGDYYWGWTIMRMGNARWMVYNDTREAFLIEFGIFQRSRRPVLKLSVIEMLRFVSGTRTGDRFMQSILAPRNKVGGPKQGFQSFADRIGGSSVLGFGHGMTSVIGGSGSGKSAFVQRNTLAGPKGRLPK